MAQPIGAVAVLTTCEVLGFVPFGLSFTPTGPYSELFASLGLQRETTLLSPVDLNTRFVRSICQGLIHL
jgi:hypothetical protein